MTWQDLPCDIRDHRRSKKQWTRILGDPGDLWFLHRCNQDFCWEPGHIYLGTASDNLWDAYAAGNFVPPMTRPEVAAKAAQTRRARNGDQKRGWNLSEETKAKMRKPKSPETIQRMREAQQRRRQCAS